MSISIIDSVFSCQQLTKVRANLLKRFAKNYIVCLTGERGIKAYFKKLIDSDDTMLALGLVLLALLVAPQWRLAHGRYVHDL